MTPTRFASFSDVPDLSKFAWPDGGPEDTGDITPPTSRVQVAKTGTFKHPIYGEFTIDSGTFASMIRNFTAGVPTDQLPVDFDHEPDMGGSSCACGWITGLEADGKGLYATVEWTWEGAYAIKSRAYRYVSPTWSLNWVDDTGAKRGPTLLAFGCTNRPYFGGMAALSLSRTFRREELDPAVEVDPSPDSPAAMEFTAQIAEVLGLEADASEEDILTAARAAVTKPDEPVTPDEPATEEPAADVETHDRPDDDPEPEPAVDEPAPDEPETFAISDAAWDGSASRFTDEEWAASCVLDRGDSYTTAKTRYGLPIKEPNGDLNRNAVHAAAGRIGQAKASPEAVSAAKRRLVSAYHQLGEDPPATLTATAPALSPIFAAQQLRDELLATALPLAKHAGLSVG